MPNCAPELAGADEARCFSHKLVPESVALDMARRIEARVQAKINASPFIINAGGDQFFCPDSSQFYYDGLKEERHLSYVPNGDHSLRGTDALARMNGPVKDYLTEPARMKRFYAAIKGRVTSPGPARPVFRSNADMMLLTTRLQLDPNGRPHIPGSIEVWRELFVHHPHGKYDGKLTKLAASWKDPDDVLEALFGLTRKAVENEPLKIFMAISDLDRQRATPLGPETVDRMAREYRTYGSVSSSQ